MSKKSVFNYFDAFIDLSKYSLASARFLHNYLKNFNYRQIAGKLKDLHDIEHKGDQVRHQIMKHLIKEFLPPIERDDISTLSQTIDDVTDAVENVLQYIYMLNIKSMRSDTINLTGAIEKSCGLMVETLTVFENFRNSKLLLSKIEELNQLKEDNKILYVKAVKNLYNTTSNPVELIKWTKILDGLNECSNRCENVANIIETIIMKNS